MKYIKFSQQHHLKVRFDRIATWSQETATYLRRKLSSAFTPVTHQAACKGFFKDLVLQVEFF